MYVCVRVSVRIVQVCAVHGRFHACVCTLHVCMIVCVCEHVPVCVRVCVSVSAHV